MVSEIEQIYMDAFHDFFGKSVRPEYTTITNLKKINNIYEIEHKSILDNKLIRCRIGYNVEPLKIVETEYRDTCCFYLTGVSDDDIAYFFRDNDYNYDLVHQIINDLFKVGQSFNFYHEMSPIKNVELENNFNKNGKTKGVTITTATKFTLSTVVATKGIQGKLTKKTVVFHLFFMLDINNEIHPIMSVSVPYSTSKFARFNINLHPSKRDEQIKNIPVMLKEFEDLLTEQLDYVLNRTLKIKKEDLRGLTLEEKKNYLPVVEMIKF